MMCPFCRNGETKVIDSRASEDFVIRRRRECLICERRFTTYEKIEESPLKVIKKDGTRVPFDREKIRLGLEKACYKRPVSESQIEAIICDVEADVYQNFDREVPSRHIGEKVFDRLRTIDQVAFVRFASVYREFKDVNDFVEELEPMLRAIGIDRIRPADHHFDPHGRGDCAFVPSTVRSKASKGVVQSPNPRSQVISDSATLNFGPWTLDQCLTT